nr:integrase, catalytic region, zinc finger, CCHC-type, peptidase aspartic, catalytic [Tanacetum cinerariifolium]
SFFQKLHYTAKPRKRDAAFLHTQLLIAQKEETGIQLQAKEFDFMAAVGDFEEIDEVNSNSILMALQQAWTSGTQTDKAPVYDSDGSAEFGRFQGQLGDLKGKSKDTPCESDTLDPLSQKLENENVELEFQVIQICLWCVDSGCSKHMTGNLKLLINFVWKFLGTVHFGKEHVAIILGYGDLQWGNIMITRVYFVEGLGHNVFSVGSFVYSNLEVAFRMNTCFVRNLEGVNMLKGNHTKNLYTINLHEMASASPICLMDRATSTKSWLWH